MSPLDENQLQIEIKKEGLRHITDEIPGFMRQKLGINFTYYDEDLKRIKDKVVISRIESLAIPPAWKKSLDLCFRKRISSSNRH